ncbi:MAG TPA: porin [Vicinamibacterales bacterium]|nr:porin [Vicinamibacterales bacterium]
MLIAICMATILAVPPDTADLSVQQSTTAQPPDRADKKPKKKKKKKTPKETDPAPDEPIDQESIEKGDGVRFVWKQHPSVRFGDVARVDFEMKMQVDGHSAYGPVKGLDPWDLHRNRIGVQGNLFKHIEYEVERELTEKELTEKDVLLGLTPRPQWKDVNVNLTYVKDAQVQIGRFKVPFGLDQLTGVTHNDYVYRSLGAIYLAPGRDTGAMVHGRFFKRGLSYWAGGFAHDGDNARSKKIAGGDETFAGRVTGKPFRGWVPGPAGSIELGTAFTLTNVTDDSFRPNGLRGRTVMTQDTFYETVYVKGHRQRWEADLDWTVGPASLRAEYTHVADQREGQGLGDENLPDARARAWYVSGTWILTGEDKKRPLKAAAPLFQGGIGGIEVAARVERLWFDSVGTALDEPFRNPRALTIFPGGDRVLTLGVSWTLNRFVKVQVNGIREHVEDPERNPVPDGAPFWSRVLRLQFVL